MVRVVERRGEVMWGSYMKTVEADSNGLLLGKLQTNALTGHRFLQQRGGGTGGGKKGKPDCEETRSAHLSALLLTM